MNPYRTTATMGMLAAALLLAPMARAKTSTTATSTTTSTTSTTLPTSASGAPTFSKATAACIKTATSNKKACKFQVAILDCNAQFIQDFSSCFTAGKGVTCAAGCATKKDACSLKVTTDKTACTKGCKKSPDPSCKATCTTNAAAAKQKCTTSFNACIVKCPNL